MRHRPKRSDVAPGILRSGETAVNVMTSGPRPGGARGERARLSVEHGASIVQRALRNSSASKRQCPGLVMSRPAVALPAWGIVNERWPTNHTLPTKTSIYAGQPSALVDQTHEISPALPPRAPSDSRARLPDAERQLPRETMCMQVGHARPSVSGQQTDACTRPVGVRHATRAHQDARFTCLTSTLGAERGYRPPPHGLAPASHSWRGPCKD